MLSLLKNAQVLLCVSFPSPLNSQFTTAGSVRKESRINTWRYFSNKMSNVRVNLGCLWTSCEHLDTLCLMCRYAPVCIHPCFWLLVLFFLVLFFFACPWHNMHLHKTLSRVSISLCTLALCLSHPVTHLVQSLVCPALLFLPNFSLHNSGCSHLNAIIRSMKSEESSLSLAVAIAVSYQWPRNSFESAYL